MTYETLRVDATGKVATVILDRPARRNSLNDAMLRDLHAVLDRAEADPSCRAVVLQGEGGVFCTGMDFEDAAGEPAAEAAVQHRAEAYMRLLRRFTTSPKVVVAKLDGVVAGGGVGLAAASDLVVATPRTEFGLPEALWGLLPCCVLPFLIRRTGFQPAYRMALTTASLSAAEARECRLVDEIADRPDDAVRRLLLRTLRVEEATIGDLKGYVRGNWILGDEIERAAVGELCRLLAHPRVRDKVAAFVKTGAFPWERLPAEGRTNG